MRLRTVVYLAGCLGRYSFGVWCVARTPDALHSTCVARISTSTHSRRPVASTQGQHHSQPLVKATHRPFCPLAATLFLEKCPAEPFLSGSPGRASSAAAEQQPSRLEHTAVQARPAGPLAAMIEVILNDRLGKKVSQRRRWPGHRPSSR
jgi:hypothetical protein